MKASEVMRDQQALLVSPVLVVSPGLLDGKDPKVPSVIGASQVSMVFQVWQANVEQLVNQASPATQVATVLTDDQAPQVSPVFAGQRDREDFKVTREMPVIQVSPDAKVLGVSLVNQV